MQSNIKNNIIRFVILNAAFIKMVTRLSYKRGIARVDMSE